MKTYPTEWQRRTMWRALTAIFLVVLVAVIGSVLYLAIELMGYLQPILIPVAIAVILTYLLDPLVTRMVRGGIPRTRAVALLFAVIFAALAALLAWLVPLVSLQAASAARELPGYTIKARDAVVDLIYRYDRNFGAAAGSGTTKGRGQTGSAGVVNWLLGSPTPTPSPAASPTPPREEVAPAPPRYTQAERQRIQEWVTKQLPNLQRQLPALSARLWEITKQSIGGFLGVTGFLFSLIMVPIYLFFLLSGRPAIQQRWKDYLPLRDSPLKDEVAAVLAQINRYVIAYFRGQLLVCLIDGLLIGTALYFFGLPFAPLIGLLVVVLTMIPYIGIVICWIPAVLIAAAHWGDWWHPAAVTLLFILIQNLEGLFLAPRIVGSSVGLHPMTVIISIFVWGLLIGGLLGPILAVPLTATIKVLLSRYVWRDPGTPSLPHPPARVPA